MKFYRSLYLDKRFFALLGVSIVLFILGFFFSLVYIIAKLLAFILVGLLVIDMIALYRSSKGIFAQRLMADKLSNGDENKIEIYAENFYPVAVTVNVIDEVPIQFQNRDFNMTVNLKPGEKKILEYHLRPTERGEYFFGSLHCYAATVIRLVRKRYSFSINQKAKVYPSYIQMRKYELLAISNKLTMAGIKKIRRIGHNMEFEHIKEYVLGDDYRSINWKATARRGKPMVNQYQDERSQQVFSMIDMGRVMKMPFEGLSLLDYAINASLVISNIAIHKEDKAGILTFSNKVHAMLPAERRNNQMQKILELLYAQQTDFLESSFENLYVKIQNKVSQRSLLLLYTNFESLSAMHRQLPYFKKLARKHLLVVIFFENTELAKLTETTPKTTEEIYIKTIGEKFAFEKRLIAKELEKHGIFSILTAPQNLTVNTVNKYLELKSRGLI